MNYRSYNGFTLIELMIAVAIVAILASIAYPSYVDYITRTARSEAQRELVDIANKMDQFFVDNRTYTTDLTALGYDASPFQGDNYRFTAEAAGVGIARGFVLVAVPTGTQAQRDTVCTRITLDYTGEKSGSSAECWR